MHRGELIQTEYFQFVVWIVRRCQLVVHSPHPRTHCYCNCPSIRPSVCLMLAEHVMSTHPRDVRSWRSGY